MSNRRLEDALKACYRGMMSSRRGSKLYRQFYRAAQELELALPSATRRKGKRR